MAENHGTVRRRIRDAEAPGHGDRYPILLTLLILDVVLMLAVPPGGRGIVLLAPFVVGTLLLGLYTSDARPRTLRRAAVAGVIVVLAAIASVVLGRDDIGGVVAIMLGALVIVTPLSILRHIFTERTVTVRTIFAAVSVYILIGLAFAFIDLGVQALHGVFFAQSGTHGPADFVYFSYIVETTVGFGDLTPAAGLPRAFVVPEAILGQVFLVTAVARLVSMYAMPHRNPGRQTAAEEGASKPDAGA